MVLSRLQNVNLINFCKSNFCATEIEYLGYILAREGIRPHPKKIQLILDLTLPQIVRQLHRVLGLVQYYRDLWQKCSEVGEFGYTKQSNQSKVKCKPWYWTEVHQKAFDAVKVTIAKDVTLAYHDYSMDFEMYTDGSETQLRAVITQSNRPIVFFTQLT